MPGKILALELIFIPKNQIFTFFKTTPRAHILSPEDVKRLIQKVFICSLIPKRKKAVSVF